MNQISNRPLLQTVAALLTAGLLNAQIATAPKYKFEVASIKPNGTGAANSGINPGPNGGVRARNATTEMLIEFAYEVRDFQIIGAPGWAKTERFDIVATPDRPEVTPGRDVNRAEMDASLARHRLRLQALLADRFGLVMKAETREMPIYSLVVVKGGSKLVEAKEAPSGLRLQNGHLRAQNVKLDRFVDGLAGILGRPVVNDTGLNARYDFEFDFTPDATATDETSPTAGGPSIFTAIREKMGLRLESKKGPGQVYVIVKVEKPSEN